MFVTFLSFLVLMCMNARNLVLVLVFVVKGD